jgi:hypothetical protein
MRIIILLRKETSPQQNETNTPTQVGERALLHNENYTTTQEGERPSLHN